MGGYLGGSDRTITNRPDFPSGKSPPALARFACPHGRGAEHHRIKKRQGAAQGHGEPNRRQNRDARCCKAPERSERSEKTHRQGERGALLAIGSGFRLTEKQRVVEADAENE